MVAHSDRRDMILSQVEIAALGKDPARGMVRGKRKSAMVRPVTLTVEQADLLREAIDKRGGPSVFRSGGYQMYATIAFIAYDLGLDFGEVLSGFGLDLPDTYRDEALYSIASRTGVWGIDGLSLRGAGGRRGQ